MKEHHLKITPEYFEEVRAGSKTAELRFDDRGYEVGDVLVLEEYAIGSTVRGTDYTGRVERRVVTSILRGHSGLAPKYAMLSLAPLCPHGYTIGQPECEALRCTEAYMIACTRNKNAGVK